MREVSNSFKWENGTTFTEVPFHFLFFYKENRDQSESQEYTTVDSCRENTSIYNSREQQL